jgi:hypothetical protein
MNLHIELHHVLVSISVALMPLQRSDMILNLSDPNIVLEPHKHCPTECLLKNGDLLVCKKAKHSLPSMLTLTPPTPANTIPNPRQTTDQTESSDDSASGEDQAIVVEDSDKAESNREGVEGETTDEDDNAELGT